MSVYGVDIEPRVGDIVQCIFAKTGYYNAAYLKHNVRYHVIAVSPGMKNALIRVRGEGKPYAESNYYRANRFKLVENIMNDVPALPGAKTTLPVKYVVLDGQTRIVATAMNEVDMQDAVQKLLMRNPFNQYAVYAFERVGKAPKIEVEWNTDLESPVVEEVE